MNSKTTIKVMLYDFEPLDPEVADAMRKMARLLLELEVLWDLASDASRHLSQLLDVPAFLAGPLKEMTDAANAVDWNTGNAIDAITADAPPHVLALAGHLDGEMAEAALAAIGRPEEDKADFPTRSRSARNRAEAVSA